MSESEPCNEVLHWKDQAKNKQQEFFSKYGDRIWWNGHPKSQRIQLEQNIGNLLYGPLFDGIDEYNPKQLLIMKNISGKIKKYFDTEICIAIIFICAYIANKIETKVVFRIWDRERQYHFDCNSRVYGSWSEYLSENNLPRCQFCCPLNGRYTINDETGEIRLEFRTSPSSEWWRYCLLMFDVMFLALALIGFITGILAQTLEDVTTQILHEHLNYSAIGCIASAAIYNILRSIYALYDMIKHF